MIACFACDALALDQPKLKALRHEFQQAAGSERARQKYVNELSMMLSDALSDYILNRRNQDARKAIDQITEELKAHPAPASVDGKVLSKRLVGKWEATRHTHIYRSNGTWRMAPESGTTSGRWRIDGNRFFNDGTVYTIICLTDSVFVFTDGTHVFLERRILK